MTRLWLLLGLTACATTGEKGGLLVPFARADQPVPLAAERRFAVVLGVDTYDDPRFTALRYASGDARRLSEALTGFTAVHTLATPESTGRARVLQEMEWLTQVADRPTDTVVVFVSSHGTLGQRPGGELERVIVTRDTRLDLPLTTGLPVAELLSNLSRLQARRRLLVLATCHSGAGKSQLSDELSRALAARKGPPPLSARSEATIVLTACAFNESAREDEGLASDVYTHFLLEALSRADRDQDGAVTASEAHDWARERTYLFTKGLQRPTSESAVLGADPIVLSGQRARAPLPVLYSYSPASDGLRVEIDGALKGTLPGGLAVPAGSHRVRLTDGTTGAAVFDGDLEVSGEHPVDLAKIIPPPLRFQVGAGVTTLIPLLPATRAAIPPALVAGGAAISLTGAALRRWSVRLGARGGGGRGLAPALETSVPFDEQLASIEVGLGHDFDLGERFSLTPTALVGWTWLWRQLRAPGFSADQTASLPWVGARLGATWKGWAPLQVGASLEVSALVGSLGGPERVHPMIAPMLQLGLRLP